MMDKNYDLSIVIPCLNEPGNISSTLRMLNSYIQNLDYRVEVITVDGGSEPNNILELQRAFSEFSEDFKLILMNPGGGYGYDIMQGLSRANGKVLSWTHADLQTDPLAVLEAYEQFSKREREDLLVKGERKNRSLFEEVFTLGMEFIVWLLLGKNLHDINAQPKLFSRKFYEDSLSVEYPYDFSLDLFTLYKAKQNGYKILSIPIDFKGRTSGVAKGGGGSWRNRINLIRRTLNYILILQERDLR